MLSRMLFEAKARWRMGLAVIVLSIAPVSMYSQGISLSQPAHPTGEQPFSGLDSSLIGAADALLVSAAQTPAAAKGQTGQAPSASLAVLYEPQIHPWNGRSTFAAARVDLLRPTIEPILRSHGVPADLVAVILVESGGRTDALSPKGARGLWQLMPDTARRYGLHVDDIHDDRVDLFRSTQAAAQYLHDLHTQFGDWKLALAAYNTGEANVTSAILRAHTQDFDQLASRWMLPLETRNYVPRVLAAAPTIGQLKAFETGWRRSDTTTVFAVSSR